MPAFPVRAKALLQKASWTPHPARFTSSPALSTPDSQRTDVLSSSYFRVFFICACWVGFPLRVGGILGPAFSSCLSPTRGASAGFSRCCGPVPVGPLCPPVSLLPSPTQTLVLPRRQPCSAKPLSPNLASSLSHLRAVLSGTPSLPAFSISLPLENPRSAWKPSMASCPQPKAGTGVHLTATAEPRALLFGRKVPESRLCLCLTVRPRWLAHGKHSVNV